ncbi:MAG: SMI1/KNR4 family protein [Cytophagales bacterium]|nr:SMI1/KNR4 family protein [Cytophagales bacterium]
MENKAKIWAQGFFERFETKIKELQAHSLIETVVFKQYQGISDEKIQKIQQEVGVELNDYIVEFFKISNGLFLAWNSHAALALNELYESSIEKDVSIDEFRVATDEDDAQEGWVSLLPLEAWVNQGKYELYGELGDTRYGEEVAEKGGMIAYLDYYNFFFDACIQLDEDKNQKVVFGNDHSACYEEEHACDFVVYMEYVLATYGAVRTRCQGLLIDEIEVDFEEVIKTQNYDILPELFASDTYVSIEEIIKYHFEEVGNEYLELEFFEDKPKEIYNQIEEVLEITITEKYE